ncbi:MAG: pyridoxamine 5'-phosphate oxidase family protein [Sphaerochaetaceae bacterium]|nr:pyridoxamine 5'-phosphate oxidase family protein [Sphaerochaetaceae bacterium]
MRRTDRQLPFDAAMNVLKHGSHGVLSMAVEENGVYAIPLNYAVEGMTIYFHGAREGTKTEIARKHPKGTLVCVTKEEVLAEQFTTQYESAIAEGHVRIVDDESERIRGFRALINRYSPEYREKGERYIEHMKDKTLLFALDIEQLQGKKRK